MTNLEKWIADLRDFVNNGDPEEVAWMYGHCQQCAHHNGIRCTAKDDPKKTCRSGRKEWGNKEYKE